jgi:hypothetical protein
MTARSRPLHGLKAAAFAIAPLLVCARAAGDPPVSPAVSREISPAPARAMRRTSNAGWLLLGVRAETARAVASSHDSWGVTGGLWAYGVTNVEGVSTETGLAAAIGGGRNGLQGQLDLRFLIGWRGYVTDWQGPFVRVGVASQYFGSFLSFVSAPAGVVGYELVENRVALDVGVHGAFAASGGYDVYNGASRDVSDSPMFGAYAWMIAGPVQAGIRWDRLWPHDQGPLGATPIDDLGTSTCVAAGRFALVVCANLDITSGPAAVPAIPALFGTTEVVQSISLGLGGVVAHAVAPPHAR